MLAKLAETLPEGGTFLYEPKWDGFRAIVFKGRGDVYIQSRDLRPLDRYFPELHDLFLHKLPDGCVVDGEIVIATPRGLDFDALQMRLHPAASRAAKLARETPAAFVGFDLLAMDGQDVRCDPQLERREKLEALLAQAETPLHLTPVTRDRGLAQEWLDRFEGAGLDGVIAKPIDGQYEPGKRAMLKVKHARTADCAVAGFRWHKSGPRRGRLPAARTVRRERPPSARWSDLRLHDGQAKRARDRAGATARACARRSPLAGVGHRER